MTYLTYLTNWLFIEYTYQKIGGQEGSVSLPLFETYEAELHGQAEPNGSACPLILAPLYS